MNIFQSKSVLITGGLGFIGSNLAIKLVELGANVTLVDNLIPDGGGNNFNINDVKEKVEINIVDICDAKTMTNLISGKDILFNLAAQTGHMNSMEHPVKDHETNLQAQISILEICRKHNPGIKIVYASTRQIYGKPDYLPVDEKHKLSPVDVNGINKMASEHYHMLYNNIHGIRSCVLRLTNTYGPRMRIKDANQMFLGAWVRAAIENKLFEVWGGEQKRDFTYVDDVVDAFLLSAANEKTNGRVFNVGGCEVVTLKSLANVLCESNSNVEFITKEFPASRKTIDIGDYYADNTSIKETLGWNPKITLKEGVKSTLDFYKLNIEKYL